MTDKQVDQMIRKLDRRIQRMRAEIDNTTNDLSYVIEAVRDLRQVRDDYRRKWLQQ